MLIFYEVSDDKNIKLVPFLWLTAYVLHSANTIYPTLDLLWLLYTSELAVSIVLLICLVFRRDTTVGSRGSAEL